MRYWIGALGLVVVMAVGAACSGGGASSAEPGGSTGAGAATAIPAVCVNVASLRTTVQKLTALDPAKDSATAIRLAANNVATQTATFVSAAPADLRAATKDLQAAIATLRAAVGGSPESVTTAIAGVDAAWKEFEAVLKATCPE